jgi:hypothetical protein
MLPDNDIEHLSTRAPGYVVSSEGGMICVMIPNFQLPEGFGRGVSDLLLRLSPGYPDVPPDMWWFSPPVSRRDGVPIAATQVEEQHLGRRWQRWSRHFCPGQWRSGIDSLESYLALVKNELQAAAPGRAA